MTVRVEMPLSEVRKNLSRVVDRVEREQARVVITRGGEPAAVVLAADDLASLEETAEILGDRALLGQIRESLREMAAGEAEVRTRDEIRAAARAHGAASQGCLSPPLTPRAG